MKLGAQEVAVLRSQVMALTGEAAQLRQEAAAAHAAAEQCVLRRCGPRAPHA